MLTNTKHTNAGSYTDSWTFSNDNYLNDSGLVTDKIGKAKATITVTPYDVTYDGNEHTATGSAKGVKNEDLTGLVLTDTKHTNAGSYTDSWSFSNDNYLNDTAARSRTRSERRRRRITVTAVRRHLRRERAHRHRLGEGRQERGPDRPRADQHQAHERR